MEPEVSVESEQKWRAIRVIFPDGSEFISEGRLQGQMKEIAGLALAQLGCLLFVARDLPDQWERRGISCNYRRAWEFCFGVEASKLRVELENVSTGESKTIGREVLGANPMEYPFLSGYRELCMMSGIEPRLTLERS